MKQSARNTLFIASISGGLAVVLGAFGAHALKELLNDYQHGIYEKAVHYQFFHTLALALIGILQQISDENKGFNLSKWLFLAGIICFSGSLYLLACRDIMTVPVAVLGPITPVGGLCFIGGWANLAWLTAKKK